MDAEPEMPAPSSDRGREAPGSAPATGDTSGSAEGGADGDVVRQAKAPWHFKVIVVGSVIYLGWRLYQGIGWLAHHIH